MELNKFIDHTLLKPEATSAQVKKLCEEAKKYDFASVCVNPSFVPFCQSELKDSTVMVCTVIGFPLGATCTKTKAFETSQAVDNGADEIDMVINIGALKDGKNEYVENDIKSVVNAARGRTVKVIIEATLLNNDEIERASKLSENAGAHFVKTSTGFAGGGATKEDVALMKKSISDKMKVKASGGIRSLESAKIFIDLGATRLGTSSGVAIMEGLESKESY